MWRLRSMSNAKTAIALLVSVAGIMLQRLPQGAEAGAQLAVKFVYYNNPNGWDASGKPCDPIGACDPFFTITLSLPDGTSSQVVTDRASDQNSIAFSDKIFNINNPLLTNTDKYSGRFTIQVKVDDYDPVGGNDYMGTFAYTYLGAAVPNGGNPVVTQVALNDDGKSGAKLLLQAWVVCGSNYYGADCSKLCVPANDDSLGHFTCDLTGSIECLSTYDPLSNCRQTFCASRPCQNGGRCSNIDTNYFCSCVGLWGGATCGAAVSACELGGSPCRNSGTCVPGTGSSGCLCPPTFTGSDCSVDVNECLQTSPPICQHATACENQPGTYSCRCQAGWQGKNCSVDVDECAASPLTCQNGGVCVNQPGNFTCVCPGGFRGARCELDVDECANNSTTAAAGSRCREPMEQCQNLQGGFICLCRSGWAGVNCSVQYLTQEEALSSQQSRLLAGILVPTLLLLALGVTTGLLGYFCLYRRRLRKAKDQSAGAEARGGGGSSSSTFTENAAYSCPRDSGVYEDADGQYTRVRSPAGEYVSGGGYETVGPASATSQSVAAVVAPPLPPKRTVMASPPQQHMQQQQDQHAHNSANYSLMSEAVSSSGGGGCSVDTCEYTISNGGLKRAKCGTAV